MKEDKFCHTKIYLKPKALMLEKVKNLKEKKVLVLHTVHDRL